MAKYVDYVSGIPTLVTPISTSAGAGDANKIPQTDGSGKLDVTFMPTGVGAATVSIVASENLSAGDFVNIYDNAGTVNCRKADNTNGRPANGFVLSAVTATQSATVYLSGQNTQLSSLTRGANYFLGTGGGVTTTAPSTTGYVIQYLGRAYATTAISFNDNGYAIA